MWYVVALNYADQIESPILAGLVDPLGLVTLDRVIRYWTAAERNARLIGLPAALAWNRGFWVAVATAVLALLYGTFRFAPPDGGRRLRGRLPVVVPSSERARPVEVPRIAGSFGFRTTVRQALAVARNALAEVATGRWFVVVLLACVGATCHYYRMDKPRQLDDLALHDERFRAWRVASWLFDGLAHLDWPAANCTSALEREYLCPIGRLSITTRRIGMAKPNVDQTPCTHGILTE
jgi:hypothetical protein